MLRVILQNRYLQVLWFVTRSQVFHESFELLKRPSEWRLLTHWGMFWLIMLNMRTALVVQLSGPQSSVSCFLKVDSSRCLKMCRDRANFSWILLHLVVLSLADFLRLMCLSFKYLSVTFSPKYSNLETFCIDNTLWQVLQF